MSESKRGIAPELLFSHVANTAPYLFEESPPESEYIKILLSFKNKALNEGLKLNHEEYFSLCLSAHYSTVATFVPTDVDNQIRQKLWDQKLAHGLSERMVEIVFASKTWNALAMTERFVKSPESGEVMSGHDGEWFSVAVGAYACHQTKNKPLALEIKNAIFKELKREMEIFLSLQKAQDGIGMLKAATIIAHNLGDLDRVMDQWNLIANDPLREFYKLGHAKKNSLAQAGDLNKTFMASENHRHYPLRAPKILRQKRKYLLPIGPFFDHWGAMLATPPELAIEDLAEIAEALVEGFLKLSSPQIPLHGYARALAGICNTLPGGAKKLSPYMHKKVSRHLSEGILFKLMCVPQKNFELEWNKKALKI